MNTDESIAERYLLSLGDVQFEPDGNITPDFLLNSKIAIEVRRLNQNYRTKNGAEGLENARSKLHSALNDELQNHPVRDPNQKYFLAVRYKRDLGEIKEIKEALRLVINEFETLGEIIPFRRKLSKNVEIEFLAKANNTDKKYALGIFSDHDSGGWVVDMYSTEVNHASSEKASKISPHQSKYQEWWLILVDHLCGLDQESLAETKKYLVKPSCFSKVIVLNAESNIAFEI